MKTLGHSAIYVESTQADIHGIVSQLIVAVGSPVVQAMAGTKDGTAPHRWAHPEGTGPDALEEQRLRLGYRVWMTVESIPDNATALTWLRSTHPELNNQTPVAFIKALHAREIVEVAEAFASQQGA